MQQAQKYYWIIIVAFSLGFFLKMHLAKQQVDVEVSSNFFQVPSYISLDTARSLRPHKETAISPINPSFLGKYPFGDSLIWKVREEWAFDDDYLYYERDTISKFLSAGLQLIPRPEIQIEDPRIPSNNLAYFPVFLPNETSSPIALFGKDSHLYATLEARDSFGHWLPISYRSPDFCGWGRWTLKINPQEYGVMLMPVYKGNFSTQLRVRYINGENISVSTPFPASIAYEQFYFDKASSDKEWAAKDPAAFARSYCFGSYPLELIPKY